MQVFESLGESELISPDEAYTVKHKYHECSLVLGCDPGGEEEKEKHTQCYMLGSTFLPVNN